MKCSKLSIICHLDAIQWVFIIYPMYENKLITWNHYFSSKGKTIGWEYFKCNPFNFGLSSKYTHVDMRKTERTQSNHEKYLHDFRLLENKIQKACEFSQMCLIRWEKRFGTRWYIEKFNPWFPENTIAYFMAFIKKSFQRISVLCIGECVRIFVFRWEKFEVSNHYDNMCVSFLLSLVCVCVMCISSLVFTLNSSWAWLPTTYLCIKLLLVHMVVLW